MTPRGSGTTNNLISSFSIGYGGSELSTLVYNYPNPFKPGHNLGTMICYPLSGTAAQNVSIYIFDLTVLAFSGQSPAGGTVDLAKFRGKVVLIQFWSTRSTPARSDMATLKELWNKYGRQFTVIGVNLDHDVRDLNAYLAENPLPWPQIHEPGGSDSRPANALGIFAVPTMILVDQQGKVVNRGIAIADLEAELKRLIQ